MSVTAAVTTSDRNLDENAAATPAAKQPNDTENDRQSTKTSIVDTTITLIEVNETDVNTELIQLKFMNLKSGTCVSLMIGP